MFDNQSISYDMLSHSYILLAEGDISFKSSYLHENDTLDEFFKVKLKNCK